MDNRFAFETGHYSQMIWAETNRVGCGYTSYLSNTSFTRPVETNLYVCNYGPAGNFLELPSYKIGSPCSQCPAKTVCSSLFPYLCGKTSIMKLLHLLHLTTSIVFSMMIPQSPRRNLREIPPPYCRIQRKRILH